MALKGYLTQRLIFFTYSFIILLILNFLIPRLMPGNPVSRFVNPLMSPQAQHQILEQFGLTEPLYIQFILYIKETFTGNFGTSFLYYPTPVGSLIEQKFPLDFTINWYSNSIVSLSRDGIGLNFSLEG